MAPLTSDAVPASSQSSGGTDVDMVEEVADAAEGETTVSHLRGGTTVVGPSAAATPAVMVPWQQTIVGSLDSTVHQPGWTQSQPRSPQLQPRLNIEQQSLLRQRKMDLEVCDPCATLVHKIDEEAGKCAPVFKLVSRSLTQSATEIEHVYTDGIPSRPLAIHNLDDYFATLTCFWAGQVSPSYFAGGVEAHNIADSTPNAWFRYDNGWYQLKTEAFYAHPKGTVVTGGATSIIL